MMWYKKTFFLLIVMYCSFGFASEPVWVFEPLTPVHLNMHWHDEKTIQYQVTNQSQQPHFLKMKPIPGVLVSGCDKSIEYKESCVLNLFLKGNQLTKDIEGGPILCEHANSNQCYRPNSNNELLIHLIPVPLYQVTSTGEHLSITPSGVQEVMEGLTQQFNVIAETGYVRSDTVSGTCPLGSWAGEGYTTGVVNNNCSVIFNSLIEQFTVLASGDAHVQVAPYSQQVNYNEKAVVTLTPDPGYLMTVLSDSCEGVLSGTIYTSNKITNNCEVKFGSNIQKFTVSAEGDSYIHVDPRLQQVNYNAQGSIQVSPAIGYDVEIANDTCGGLLVGALYTTSNVTHDCHVSFNAIPKNYLVTPQGTHVNISPSTPQTVSYGNTKAFNIIANSGYAVNEQVHGSCPIEPRGFSNYYG